MRFKSVTMLAALALLTLAPTHARARQQSQKDDRKDEKVIEDFVTTRGVSFDTPAKTTGAKQGTPSRRRQGSGSTAKSSGANSSGGVASTKKNGAKQGTTASANSVEVAEGGETPEPSSGGTADGAQFIKASAMMRSLALGYTIYVKDATGALLPVPLSKSYKSGDRIAIVLETNADGYLYVFDAENGKNPQMLYPNVQLNHGGNEVRAHVRETYPADLDLAFEFDATPATEHLFIVVSREPLAGVPTGDALEKFCAKNREDCYWRPTAAQWVRISAAASDRGIVEAKNTQIAQANVEPVMPAALQRGIKLKKEEPAPSIVRVSDSPDAKMLVTKIELVHN
jgi:hypothetical protein